MVAGRFATPMLLNRLRGLPRDVWLVGLISLVNDGASDLIYPLLPLYLTSVLMAGPKALGLIEGIAEATGSLLRLVSGALSDRSGRSGPPPDRRGGQLADGAAAALRRSGWQGSAQRPT